MNEMKKKSRTVKIAPSVLSADFSRLEEELNAIEKAGADYIHVDVMDGHFVPNITIGPPVVESIRKVTSLPLDVHLMIENPDRFIASFADAGASIITVHVETSPHLHKTLQSIKSRNLLAGVVLNPATPLSSLDEVYEYIDMVLLMSVNPGFGGQQFIPSVLDKICKLRKSIDDRCSSIEIEIDGGVKTTNADKIIAAGADILVAGTAVFHSDNYQNTINRLRGCSSGER